MTKNYSAIYLILLVLSFATAYLLLVTFFPYFAISFFFLWLIIGTIALKRRLSRFDLSLFTFTLAFAVFILFRSSPLLIFLDIVGIIFFGAAALLHRKEHISFLSFITAPILALSESLKAKNVIQFDVSNFDRGIHKFKSFSILNTIISVVVTIILLAVILPLLASANGLFAQHLKNILNSFTFITVFFSDSLALNIMRIVLGIFIFFLTRSFLSYAVEGQDTKVKEGTEGIHWTGILLLPKIVIAIVIGVFFFSQYELYFATAEVLRSINSSNSEQTREIFGQLLIVSFIVFGLIYLDKSRRLIPKILTYILVLQGIFLSAIGLKSVYDYIGIGGFTTKRLYGVTGIFWLVSVYILFLYDYIRPRVSARFIKQVVLLSAITLLSINIANFDYLIYHVKQSKSYMGIDYEYLVSLSDDAYGYQDMFEKLKNSHDTNQRSAFTSLIYKIDRLQRVYDKPDIRAFNISTYEEYLSVKDIDITPYNDQTCYVYKNLSEALKHPSLVCVLDLSNQQLTQVPQEVFTFQNLKTLTLFGNNFTQIPDEIKNLKYLKQLDLRNNLITSVPASIAELNYLETLELDTNQISELPPEIGNLKNLTRLSITDNRLKTIPSTVGNLQELQSLSIYSNQIEEIPDSIGSLKHIHFFYAADNKLKKVPNDIANWQELESLDVQQNNLSQTEVTRIVNTFPNLPPSKIMVGSQK